MTYTTSVALMAALLALPSPVSAHSVRIDVQSRLEGCAGLTQQGPFALIMGQTCARVAVDACRVGPADGDLNSCLDGLNVRPTAKSDALSVNVPGGAGRRASQTDMFERLTAPETCPFQPPPGADKSAHCRAVCAGTQWQSWRDAARRPKD